MRADRPRVAIIGAGLMGHWHAVAARRSGAEVVAVVDSDPARRAALARRAGTAACSNTAELFGSSRQATVAHICTPADTHCDIARALMDRGLHVVCEKPIALRAGEVSELYACARRAGRRLCPVHQFTAQRGVAEALSRVPAIGELRRIAFTFNSAGGERHAAAVHDALVAEILPHPLSVLVKLQPQHPLSAIDWNVQSPAPGELLALGTQGAALVSIAISLSARPTQAAASIAAADGSVALDFFHGYATVNRGKPSRADKALRPFVTSLAQFGAASRNALRRTLAWESAYPGLRTLLATFYASIDGSGGAAPFRDDEVIDVYRARDDIAARIACTRRS